MKKLIPLGLFFLLTGMQENASAQVTQQDSLALVDLYNSTNGSSWTDTTNWLSGPVSSWFGITVSGGRVTMIDMFGNNMSGSIPASIGNLTNLTYLGLGANNLTDSIPSEIGNLTNLTEIFFNNNKLVGSIPASVGNLTNLTLLTFGRNTLTGEVPSSISNLVNLDDLNLQRNDLSGEPLPLVLNLTNLTSLDLEFNNFTGTIPSNIDTLTALTTLRINTNQFTGSIPPRIGNMIALTQLHVYANQLTGTIPPEIGNLANLTNTGLQANQLTGPIPPEIGNLTNLTTLQIWGNQLSGSIPSTLGNLTALQNMYIFNMQLSGSLPPELGNLTLLRNLWAGQNQFTGTIPLSFGNLSSLTNLRLNGNQLEGIVPDTLRSLSSLIELELNGNRFVDLPDLSPISTLNELRVENNLFTFEDIEPNVGVPTFTYSPQDSIGQEVDTIIQIGSSLTLSVAVGGTANQYQWMKDNVDITGATNAMYTIPSVMASDSGSYRCRISNTIATDLDLYSRPVHVNKTVVGIEEPTYGIPREFALHQNYPNPFNPSTNIEYALPHESYVTLRVYNVLGQEAITLVDAKQPAGFFTIEWDGRNLTGTKVSSGTYFYRLEAKDATGKALFASLKKLLLVK